MKLVKYILLAVALVVLGGWFNHRPASRKLQSAGEATRVSVASQDPYEMINENRYLAGLPEFYRSRPLERAAANHARYLVANPINSTDYLDYHREIPGRRLFTGINPSDRGRHVGYPSDKVSENISFGSPSQADAITSLMAAIYHRFGFLDYTVSEIGIARRSKVFVYDMGNRQLAQICTDRPEYFAARSYLRCGDYLISSDDEEYLCRHLPEEARLNDIPKGLKCGNGTVIDGEYLRDFCDSPPAEALIQGPGSYYSLCDGRYRVRRDWLDALCRDPGPAAYRPRQYFTLSSCPDTRIKSEWRERLCSMVGTSDMDEALFYPDICHGRFLVSVKRWEESEGDRLATVTDYVVWPPEDYPTPTSFSSEYPDPLPDLEISGYPVSIHFNPYTTEDVHVFRFSLQRYDDVSEQWLPVNKIRRLDQRSDPNHKFTSRQFAWFPLDPLSPRTTYRVEIGFSYNGEAETLRWAFETRPQ